MVADGQIEQAPPPVPHEPVAWGSQTLPLQHPPGHEAALQTHAPLTQACPMAHSAPEPHAHAPPAHDPVRAASHAMQVAPSMPHCETDGVTHVEPTQQPVGHEPLAPGVHAQVPPTQACPAPQGGPLPHEQSPIAEHLSVLTGSHATHASPPNPQAACERALQLGPEQQPVAHVDAQPEQAPPLQVWPDGQLAQALPPLPHSPGVLPGWQRLPWQHPRPHETPSQTHAPLRHRWPVAHAGLLPHWHAPVEEQLSVSPAGHAAHAAPGAAHAAVESVVQTLPAQHPVGHDVASQTQAPCEQCRPWPHGAPAPQ